MQWCIVSKFPGSWEKLVRDEAVVEFRREKKQTTRDYKNRAKQVLTSYNLHYPGVFSTCCSSILIFFFISSQVSFSNEDSACPEYYFLLKCWDINGCCRARAPRTSSHLTSITDSHTPSLPCFTWPLSLRS